METRLRPFVWIEWEDYCLDPRFGGSSQPFHRSFLQHVPFGDGHRERIEPKPYCDNERERRPDHNTIRRGIARTHFVLSHTVLPPKSSVRRKRGRCLGEGGVRVA